MAVKVFPHFCFVAMALLLKNPCDFDHWNNPSNDLSVKDADHDYGFAKPVVKHKQKAQMNTYI